MTPQEKPSIVDKGSAVDLESLSTQFSVKFENVSFNYDDNGRNILDGLNFEIPAGQSLALVGASGSGKSTILRLLFRFYEPSGGSIKVGGHDVRDVTLDSLRRAIGVVPQDTVLFNETIAYNIRYGKPGCTDEEVRHVAQQASIDEAIDQMPLGYNTLVGERGLRIKSFMDDGSI